MKPSRSPSPIDEGVDLGHEDLTLVPGYDATGQGSKGAPNSWDGHGTAVAGIIAAIADNGLGVAGVAPNVKIMPVRIGYTSSPDSSKWISTNTRSASGIRWAADQGAKVLNNSWGGGSPSSAITRAIQYARNTKSVVVIFAVGNDNASVVYPAALSEVIAVGASSPCDERKSPTSCDGEYWWGSNLGDELDVVAPGVLNFTIDITGTGGYNDDPLDKDGNYRTDFRGTSSATPHVAGLAALIVSINPNLTPDEVQSIIEDNTDDLGSPGWDSETGYGRINTWKAANAAAQTLSLG